MGYIYIFEGNNLAVVTSVDNDTLASELWVHHEVNFEFLCQMMLLCKVMEMFTMNGSNLTTLFTQLKGL
jgi:hypothetical protein